MSFRPSGCGGRNDAAPPHVEKRRRPRTPSSFIMGTARQRSLGGREGGETRGGGGVEDLRGSGSGPIRPTRRVSRANSPANTDGRRLAQMPGSAVLLPLSVSFCRLLPASLPLSFLSVCERTASKYLMTNQQKPSHSLSCRWVGELHLSEIKSPYVPHLILISLA